MVSHVQIQRGQCAREQCRARGVSASCRRQIESRLDQRRSGDHEAITAIRPSRRSALRALSGKIGRADCLPGIAHQGHGLGETRNRVAHGRLAIISGVMPRVFVSSVVDAPAEKVWASDYSAIRKGLRRHRWTRIFTDTEIRESPIRGHSGIRV